jgi:hypothetical protein
LIELAPCWEAVQTPLRILLQSEMTNDVRLRDIELGEIAGEDVAELVLVLC